jgi:hypothetical protein
MRRRAAGCSCGRAGGSLADVPPGVDTRPDPAHPGRPREAPSAQTDGGSRPRARPPSASGNGTLTSRSSISGERARCRRASSSRARRSARTGGSSSPRARTGRCGCIAARSAATSPPSSSWRGRASGSYGTRKKRRGRDLNPRATKPARTVSDLTLCMECLFKPARAVLAVVRAGVSESVSALMRARARSIAVNAPSWFARAGFGLGSGGGAI